MNTIKKLKHQDKDNYLQYLINGEPYRAYEVGNLPNKFGFHYNKETEKEGIGNWFTSSKMGLTFVSEGYFVKWG
jgi:hypothetical protein